MRRRARCKGVGFAGARAAGLAAALVVGAASSGCAWAQHGRPVREGDRLELESAIFRVPPGPGWNAWRSFDVGSRSFELARAGSDGAADAWAEVSESEGATPVPPRDILLERLSSWARARLGDPEATVEEVAVSPPASLGEDAVAVAVRVEERAVSAGRGGRSVVEAALAASAPAAAPGRALVVAYAERTTAGGPGIAKAWRDLLDGIEIRPVSPANVAAAARARGYPKVFEPGLARRSLTLPQLGFQWTVDRERRLAHDGFTGGWGAALGLTDRLELDTPGFLRLALGEPEALRRPEVALGAGLTGYEHDAARGNVWAFGASAQARKRVSRAFAVRGLLLVEGAHESRTGRSHRGSTVSFGVVWDVHELVSLGLDTGYALRPWREEDDLVWVGGRGTPLVTLHLPFLDVGLSGAAAWNGERTGLLAGASLLLTL